MPLTPITEDDFQRVLAESAYYKGRWGYMNLALQYAGCPESVLELGPHQLPLFPGGHTIDTNVDLEPTYCFDASKIPWPVETGHYALFVGLQVWEHLGESQASAFREVMRIARRAILSFPYLWDCPADPMHHGIDEEVIARWTCGVPWLEAAIDNERMVCHWEFS